MALYTAAQCGSVQDDEIERATAVIRSADPEYLSEEMPSIEQSEEARCR